MTDSTSGPDAVRDDEALSFRKVPMFLWVRGLSLAFVVFGLAAYLHYYVGYRLFGAVGFSPGIQALGYATLAALFVSLFLGFASTRREPSFLTLLFVWVGFSWMGTFGLLIVATFATDVARWALLLAAPAWATPEKLPPLQSLAIIALVAPAAAFGLLSARGKPKVERTKVPLEKLPPGMEGLRIVQLSDVHIGPTLKRRWLEKTVAKVNALDPDVVVLTGDLVDGTVKSLRDDVKPFGDLRAKLGVYYVTGNHEYYSGALAWIAEMRKLGITPLLNEHRVLERSGGRLVLAGVTDYDGGKFHPDHESRPDKALAGAPVDVPRVLLAHQPRSAPKAAGAGVDLQLSGHTHGGQMFPWMFLVRLQQPVISGLKKLHGFWVYTHRGTGYWGPPIRLGAPPEIAELTLTRA